MTDRTRPGMVAAGLWSALDLSARFGIQFGVSIVLARLLTPTDFGIYALTAVFVALSSVLVDGGFSTALIQRETVSREEGTAVFWFNLLAAAALGCAILAAAPAIARLFDQPVLGSLLGVSAAVVVISAVAAVPGAMLQRALRFDLVAKAGLAASVSAGSVAMVAAWRGAGIWSLAYQSVTYAAVNAALLWLVGGWRPQLRPHWRAAGRLARFGSLVALSGLLEVAYAQGSALVVGKLHGPRELGFYNRGQTLQTLPASILAAIVTRIALPVFSTRAGDPSALRRGAAMAQGVVMLVNLPLMAALVVLPDQVLTVLYGPQWLPAAPVLAILAAGGTLFPLHAVNLQLLLAQGRSDIYLRVEVAKKLVGVACVGMGSLFGITGLAIGQTVFVLIAFFINARAAGGQIGYGPLAQLRDLAPTWLATAVMALLLLGLRPLMPADPTAALAILTLAGSAGYAAALLLLRVEAVHELLRLARR